jgi:hypothetical protein
MVGDHPHHDRILLLLRIHLVTSICPIMYQLLQAITTMEFQGIICVALSDSGDDLHSFHVCLFVLLNRYKYLNKIGEM